MDTFKFISINFAITKWYDNCVLCISDIVLIKKRAHGTSSITCSGNIVPV